jgi:hypothetical protein
VAVGVAGPQTEVGGRRRQQRHDGECHQRQPPVHPEHDDDHARQRDHVGRDREQSARERLAHRFYVVEDARHQASDRVPVEERRFQAQQVLEQRGAQVVRHALPGHGHQVRLHHPEPVQQGQCQRVQTRGEGEPPPVRRQDVLVDRHLQ